MFARFNDKNIRRCNTDVNICWQIGEEKTHSNNIKETGSSKGTGSSNYIYLDIFFSSVVVEERSALLHVTPDTLQLIYKTKSF